MTRWRRVLIVLLVVVLVFLAGRAGLDIWASRKVSAEVSRLEAKYGSLDDKTLRLPAVPDADNRGRAMRAAAALVVGRDGVPRSIASFTALKVPAPVPEDLRMFVTANREALRVADEARTRRQSNWEADYSSGNTPSLLDVRALSDAIYLTSRIELDEGRVEEAAAATLTGLALSASLRQEPNLIVQLIRIAVGARHFEAVQRLITGFEPAPETLERLASFLEENREPDPLDVGLLSELKHFNGAMARIEGGLEMAPEGAAGFIPSTFLHSRLARPLMRVARLRYLEQMRTLLDLQTGPRPRPAAPPQASWWSPLKRAYGIAGPGLERAMDSSDTFKCQLSLTELAVALRRFRSDRGHYPDSLEALVPTYLAAVPLDPLTGKAPEYSRQGAGFRLVAEKGNATLAQTTSTLEWNVSK